MKIYTITHAMNLTGDYCGDACEALSTYARSYRTLAEANSAIWDDIKEMIGYALEGLDDHEREEEEFRTAIKSETEIGNVCGRHNIREYELEMCDRVFKWSIFEQEI